MAVAEGKGDARVAGMQADDGKRIRRRGTPSHPFRATFFLEIGHVATHLLSHGGGAFVVGGRVRRGKLHRAADAQGIPAATMPDGTPNGYAVLTVKQGGDYALVWREQDGPPLGGPPARRGFGTDMAARSALSVSISPLKPPARRAAARSSIRFFAGNCTGVPFKSSHPLEPWKPCS